MVTRYENQWIENNMPTDEEFERQIDQHRLHDIECGLKMYRLKMSHLRWGLFQSFILLFVGMLDSTNMIIWYAQIILLVMGTVYLVVIVLLIKRLVTQNNSACACRVTSSIN